MATADDKNNRDEPTGGMAPQHPSDATRKWLDTVLTPGETGSQNSSDPIARNPKDVGKPGEMIQATESTAVAAVPVPAAGVALSPADAPWGGRQHMAAAPSTTDLLVSVLRFKWTILIIWILVSAPIIAAVWTQIVPQYAGAGGNSGPADHSAIWSFKTDENGQSPSMSPS